jgi:hypothetical protein
VAVEQGQFLAVKNWAKYQTATGKMRWIKVAVDLEDDFHYAQLSFFQRALLQSLWRVRGRIGRNLHNDVTWIAQATHAIPTDRAHIGHALGTLIARGFLVPTNQQDDSIDKNRKEEKREEQNTTSAPSEPVVEPPKIEKVKIVIPPPKIFELPPWVHQATWMDYELMRKKLGKPMTDRARELILRKLEGLMNRGHPPQEVLEESIVNNWAGVFELKGNRNGGNRQQQPSKTEQREARGAEVIRNLARDLYGDNGLGEHDLRAQTHGPSKRDGDETHMAGTPVILPPISH